MASIGHIAIGMAAARVDREGGPSRWSAMALWPAVSLLPDIDVIGFAMGVPYADPWGHRGATHSLVFSIALGLAIGLAARWFKRPVLRTALIASVVLASHAALDTMTDGGLGCALFWPFDQTRYFAPWQPIPVAPIGMAFFSHAGLWIALIELVLFAPALLFALRSRRVVTNRAATGLFCTVWLVSVWLIASGDPIRENIVGIVLGEDTAYASGFSEAGFRSITPGASPREVRRLIGAPLDESWFYSPKDQPFEPAMTRAASFPRECLTVRFESGIVVAALARDACRKIGVDHGMALSEVERLLGSPPESCWRYTWSPRNGRHRMRMVCFLNERVDTVIRRWE